MGERPRRDVAAWRREYEDRGLADSDLGTEPMTAFARWLSDAQSAGLHEPNAMVVATVDRRAPSARMVLLKTVDERGFVFYTNYHSRKSGELAVNAACALVFPWHSLARQVRVEGVAEQVSPTESDAYFATRPRAAQIGAWASPQSEPVPDREFLQARYQHELDRFEGCDAVPRQPHWGGILVRPHTIEFWQGRPGRLHDRLRFERVDGRAGSQADVTQPGGAWALERLAP
ncbi:MAG: pyridoxamine 5'-phosphate oxidase [Nocardioidaceae bacterium]